jgi:hypothetical protein
MMSKGAINLPWKTTGEKNTATITSQMAAV